MCLSIFAKIQFGRTFFPLLFCVDFVTDGSCRKWKMSSSSSNSILRCDICEKKWDGYVISNDWKTINIPKNTGKFYEQIIWLHTTVIRTTKTGSTNMRENISVKKPEKAHDYMLIQRFHPVKMTRLNPRKWFLSQHICLEVTGNDNSMGIREDIQRIFEK